MLDLLITTVGIFLIYILLFFCITIMKKLVFFLMLPNFVIILVLIYADINYKKFYLWQYPEEYSAIQRTKFLPIKSIKGILDPSGNVKDLDFEKTDGIFSIEKNDEYSKECLHNYYIKQTNECPITDIILEKGQVTHNNYIEQKISNNMYLYYKKESNLDGKLYHNILIESAASGSSCNENNEFNLVSGCSKIDFVSNINAENILSIKETEEQKKSDPFNSLKKYANYSDKICILLIIISFVNTFYEPPSNKRFNAYKIISWICHFLVLILLIIRYHKYRRIKQFFNKNKETYIRYLPRMAFNLDTVTISISISIFIYFIFYLIIPDKCHYVKGGSTYYTENDNTEQVCLKDWMSKFSAFLLPIFIASCFMIIYDVMNDIKIIENYKIINSNWMQNSVQSLSTTGSINSINWKSSHISYSSNNYNYFNISKSNADSKICGKDSQGNDLYFPKDVECPINDIFISKTDSDEYADYTKIELSDGNEFLYYTNKKTTGKIVISLLKNTGIDPLDFFSSSGVRFDEFEKITKSISKISHFNNTFIYEELDSWDTIRQVPEYDEDDEDYEITGYHDEKVLYKLYALNYLGVNDKLIGKVKDFGENLDKYQKLTKFKYISYAFNAFDFIFYNCIFIFEENAYLCFYGLGIIFLPTTIFFVIINLWCLHININYVEFLLNRINIDFERNRCDCIWNFLLTFIGILFSIFYVFIVIHGLIEKCECDCFKKGNYTSPTNNRVTVVNYQGSEGRDSKEKINKIFKDNKNVGDGPICVVCLISKANIILKPCQHKCVCKICFDDINSKDPKQCPVCRQDIEGKI